MPHCQIHRKSLIDIYNSTLVLAKEVSFSASTLGTVEEINVRDLSGNTLSDIHLHLLKMSHRHTRQITN